MKRTPISSWRVWLTGASSGIGEALARELCGAGASVALFARRGDRLRALAGELGAGDRILVQEGDVRDRERVLEAVAEAETRFGGLDVALLNAGIGDQLELDAFDSALVERILATNFLGAVYGIEAVLPGMLRRGRGIIAGVSSIGGVRGVPRSGPYCASKAALNTLLESLRVELRPQGVNVVTVSPGFVRTPLTDRNEHKMPFLMEPDRAARIILKGIRKRKSHVHFPKRLTLPVLALGLLPMPLYDRIAARLVRGNYRKRKSEEDS